MNLRWQRRLGRAALLLLTARAFIAPGSPDGGTHVWIGRRIGVGCGEGSSGLECDTIARKAQV
jgi:hypothetical protein